jgi:putative polyketide hydroxylase
MSTRSHDVIVVGAGPVGLALVLALRRAGVDAVAVDSGTGPATYPKARVVSVRSMELLRRWGIADEIRAAAVPGDWAERIVAGRSVAGDELIRGESPFIGNHRYQPSPESRVCCTQDNVERILWQAVSRSGAGAVHWRTRALDVSTAEESAVVETIDEQGQPGRWQARYVVLADGTRGLGATAMPGGGVRRSLVRQLSVWLETDLRQWVEHRPAFIYYLTDRRLTGQLLCVDGKRQWIVSAAVDRATTERDVTSALIAQTLARVIGVPASHPAVADAVVKDVRLWTIGLRVASEFLSGRVLRAGDAAHELPPTGGMGLNLGLVDADALAWRLRAVLRGWGSPALLDQYGAERQAAAQRTAQWARGCLNTIAALNGAAARDDVAAIAARTDELRAYVYHPGLDLGPLLPPQPIDPHLLIDDGRTGSRAPHVLTGPGRSTLDCYGDSPVLLLEAANAPLRRLAETVSRRTAVPLTAVRLSERDGAGRDWAARHGISPDGAVLVRPDGYIAWRAVRVELARAGGEQCLADALLDVAGGARAPARPLELSTAK